MQVIIMNSRLGAMKTIHVMRKHIILFFSVLSLLLLTIVFSTWQIAQVFSDSSSIDWTEIDSSQMTAVQQKSLEEMARKVGVLQAQMQRLQELAKEVSEKNGLEFDFNEEPGQGGIFNPTESMTTKELSAFMQTLDRRLTQNDDYFTLMQSRITEQTVKEEMFKNVLPVHGYISSSFGSRIDPFTGGIARHDGQDFSAPTGTPILAAAPGIVLAAKYHPGYGNLVEILHGDGITTRYAHASELFVRSGDFVKQGQKIASVGSTGRSTGPHLHFEVRIRGEAVDPMRYLNKEGMSLIHNQQDIAQALD